MISRELAEKLKDAGLLWEPQNGDVVIDDSSPRGLGIVVKLRKVDDRGFFEINYDHGFCLAVPGECTWLPSLSQLLAEIEKRGYGWDVEKLPSNEKVYACFVIRERFINGQYCCDEVSKETMSDTPEEAAAEALLWVLKEGGSND